MNGPISSTVRIGESGDFFSQIALSEMVVEGILTNIPLHRDLMVDARFIEGGTNIHYLEQKLAKDAALGITGKSDKADA